MGVLAEVLLFAAAWFGHAFLMTVCLNWWYSHAFPRRLLTRVRLLVAVLVFTFPVVLAWAAGGRLRDFWPGADPDGAWPLRDYLWLCWFVSGVYLPVVSVVRALRRDPAQVVYRGGTVVDVAARLKEPPIGDGHYWR